MKKAIIMAVSALILVSGLSLEARYRHHGRWGGYGYGWGPALGFGLSIPVGSSKPRYIETGSLGDPFNRFKQYFPKTDPFKKPEVYRRWLYDNYSKEEANTSWRRFANQYNRYQSSKPSPAGYISIGTGYGGYPYWGGYPYYGGYWGRPYGGIGFGVGF